MRKAVRALISQPWDGVPRVAALIAAGQHAPLPAVRPSAIFEYELQELADMFSRPSFAGMRPAAPSTCVPSPPLFVLLPLALLGLSMSRRASVATSSGEASNPSLLSAALCSWSRTVRKVLSLLRSDRCGGA